MEKSGEYNKNQQTGKPVTAPGNDEYLDQDATQRDMKEGNSTKVVKLVFDEVDPS